MLINGPMYPDVIGGAEIVAYELSLEFSKKGYEVHLIAFKGRRFRSIKLKSNLICHAISSRMPFRYIQSFVELIKIKPTIILTIILDSAYLGYVYSRLWNVPLVVRPSGSDIYGLAGIIGMKAKRYASLRLLLKIIRGYAYFIAISKDLVRKLYKLGVKEDRVCLIPNPINPSFFEVSPKAEGNTIVFIGSLRNVKGVDVLLKSLSILKNERGFPDVHLLIIGDGPKRKELETLIKLLKLNQAVEIMGYVPYERVKYYLAKATIFVLPSRSEGLSTALLQAMAAGLRVVATNVGGNAELVENGKTGILIPPEDPVKLAEAISMLLQNKELAKELRFNARKRVEDYKVEKIVRRYEEFFFKILKNKKIHLFKVSK
ncbi:MAG: glycosyltransferase family 4 protein [Candidatus Bathyarchaeia archaeon]